MPAGGIASKTLDQETPAVSQGRIILACLDSVAARNADLRRYAQVHIAVSVLGRREPHAQVVGRRADAIARRPRRGGSEPPRRYDFQLLLLLQRLQQLAGIRIWPEDRDARGIVRTFLASFCIHHPKP